VSASAEKSREVSSAIAMPRASGGTGADLAGLGARRKEPPERQAKRKERPVLVGDVLERESGQRGRALGILRRPVR
jgi:hypothetical protein